MSAIDLGRNLIVIEGNEATGKTELVKVLSAKLAEKQVEHVTVRSPGGTDLNEEIRTILLKKDRTEVVDPVSDILFHLGIHRQNIKNIITQGLIENKWVICERFIHSTWCLNVQPYLTENPRLADMFMGNMQFVVGNEIPEPITFLLTLPEEVRLQRLAATGKDLDRYESKSPEFYAQVALGYDTITNDPSVRVLDATLSPDELSNIVIETVYAHQEKLAQQRKAQEESIAKLAELKESEPSTDVDGAEQVDEKPIVEFNLEDSIQKYVDENIIPELFSMYSDQEKVASLVETYKEHAAKFVRDIYVKSGNQAEIFDNADEINKHLHSIIHYRERFNHWIDAIDAEENSALQNVSDTPIEQV